MKSVVYYEIDKTVFGLNFPLGIKANDLARKLKRANRQLCIGQETLEIMADKDAVDGIYEGLKGKKRYTEKQIKKMFDRK